MVYLTLPWPPSANRYYRTVNGRPILSKVAREYRKVICTMYNGDPISGRISVTIEAYPPDQRKRDLDNLLKQTLDALQHAGVYLDDSQIDQILIKRGMVRPNGSMRIEIDGNTGHNQESGC